MKSFANAAYNKVGPYDFFGILCFFATMKGKKYDVLSNIVNFLILKKTFNLTFDFFKTKAFCCNS